MDTCEQSKYIVQTLTVMGSYVGAQPGPYAWDLMGCGPLLSRHSKLPRHRYPCCELIRESWTLDDIFSLNQGIEPSGEWKLDGSNTRVAGLLILAISTSLKHEKYSHRISPTMFQYATAFLGRISHALGDVLDRQSLLAYLSHGGDWVSEVESKSGPRPAALPVTEGQPEASAHVLSSVKFVLATVKSLWLLVKSGCTREVLKALRCCKESLWTVQADSLEYASAVAFALQYIHVVKLLTKIWQHFVIPRKWHVGRIGDADFLLQKLHKVLLALRCQFVGLTGEDELHVLELLLLGYIISLSSFHINCRTLDKLSKTITCVNSLRTEKRIASSEFVDQLAELLSKSVFSDNDVSCSSLQLRNLTDIFALNDFSLAQSIRCISAELLVQGFDSVRPLRFIQGLPVGVPLEISLYNVTIEHRLWVKMTSDQGLTEFIYVDVEFGGSQDVTHFVFTAPFYRTPKTVAFTLRVSIGMECVLEDLRLVKGHGGPKHSLVYLSPEKEVYFLSMNS
ncbi:hypothetical protein Cgig2_012110 [Carnegiea gigantea]|uniref:Uncharacterized protein n=1 Tax=Carnegiea gigantea TaxID=171969 RepID=A0A9Q1QAP0_9CARY|nr:hypothetical protein Cgig2_012110 [Carnegiea gigantea]